MSSPLLEDRHEGVLVLTLNRPEKRNAINREVSTLLAAAMDRLDADPELQVGVLTGAGSTFSSGMDLKAFLAGEHPSVEGRGVAGFAEAPPKKPLIAAVEGYALAGGFEMALACDLIVASTDAQFGLPETRRGLIAAGGGLIRLARRIPLNVAMEISLTGAMIGADRAQSLGLVNRLTEPEGALAGALELAAEIAAAAPFAVTASKEIIGFANEHPESESWSLQRPIDEAIRASADAAEGASAFSEKRAPVWTGRR